MKMGRTERGSVLVERESDGQGESEGKSEGVGNGAGDGNKEGESGKPFIKFAL